MRLHRAPLLLALILLLGAGPSLAAGVTGPADAGRIDERMPNLPEPTVAAPTPEQHVLPPINAPQGSKALTFTLHSVTVDGMHALSEADVQKIYMPYVGRVITLDTVWLIAQQITDLYHDRGYFLSQVTVPAQELGEGNVQLHAVEGYIGEVVFDDPLKDQPVVRDWIARLQSYHPITQQQIESILLQLNDLPGLELHSVLEPMPNQTDGAVRVTLVREKTHGTGQVGIDDNGSRYLGPYEMSAQYDASFLPLEDTSLGVMGALPLKKMRYGSIHQEIPLYPALNLELYGSNTVAKPGYTLSTEDIDSNSLLVGMAFNYKWIRQRQENLSTRVAFESRDTTADILGTPLTRDHIRVLRAGLTYEKYDNWAGNNLATFTFTEGLDGLGASAAGSQDLSRAQATPDFQKAELLLTRVQGLGPDWNAVASASGQWASGPLFSSEEFGYGGQAFGRAYDDSEITGDEGIAGTLELRYMSLPQIGEVSLTPYGFYDIGKIWNDDVGQVPSAAGSSAGAGVRFVSSHGITANLGLAFPLTRPIDTPLYGNGKNPRYLVQVMYGF